MRIQQWCISTLAIACCAAVACSSTPSEPDDEVSERPDEADQKFEPQVPDYRELSFDEDEPDVVELSKAGDVSSFRVGSVDVIHMPTPANEVVAARLYLSGGSVYLNEDLAGIERLALDVAVNGGTQSTPKDEFNARLDAVGSSVGFTANRDFSGYTMRSVGEHFDETWELFTEAIFEPAFIDEEVELRRDRQLASIASVVDNPDSLVSEVARDLAFENHPYFHRQIGTERTVSQFSTDHLRAWQRHLMAPERMLLVVVGNIDRAELIDNVKEGLGRLAPTGLDPLHLPGIAPQNSALRVENLDLPTNYILGYYAAPRFGHDDYPALVLATQHLRDRLFEEVRTRKGLTYAVSSGLGNRVDNVGFLYVTAVDPGATMPVIFDEVESLKSTAIDADTLEKVRNVYLTRHYMDLETNGSIAGQLARAELIGGDWRLSGEFLDTILNVTPEDIQRVADDYMKNFQFGVVGDPDDVPPAIFGVDAGETQTVDEVDDVDVDDIEEAPETEPTAAQ